MKPLFSTKAYSPSVNWPVYLSTLVYTASVLSNAIAYMPFAPLDNRPLYSVAALKETGRTAFLEFFKEKLISAASAPASIRAIKYVLLGAKVVNTCPLVTVFCADQVVSLLSQF